MLTSDSSSPDASLIAATDCSMHKQGKLWGLWLVPAIGGLVVLSGVQVAANRESSNRQKELSIALQQLRSQVAEAGVLAERARHDDLTSTFTREHASQLARHLRASLAEVREKGAKADQPAVAEHATRLGAEASTSLQRVAESADAPATLGDVAAQMAGTARELTRLDAGLRKPSR